MLRISRRSEPPRVRYARIEAELINATALRAWESQKLESDLFHFLHIFMHEHVDGCLRRSPQRLLLFCNVE